jgi:hypothetical protein
MAVTLGAVEVMAGIVLFVVILFSYLGSARDRVLPLAEEAWETRDGYFPGRLLIALFDAVLIGIGLLVHRGRDDPFAVRYRQAGPCSGPDCSPNRRTCVRTLPPDISSTSPPHENLRGK